MTHSPLDISLYLDSEELISELLSQVIAEKNPALLLSTLNAIARAKGMTALARQTGLSRESLYKSLCPGSHPRFETVMRIIQAFGLCLTVSPAAKKT